MSRGELAFLRRRLAEERALAEQITYQPEQRFHQRLADLYVRRIEKLDDAPERTTGPTVARREGHRA